MVIHSGHVSTFLSFADGAPRSSIEICEIFNQVKRKVFKVPFSFSDGSFMDETIAKTNVFYGGLDPSVHNVFFTHGEMDPRRSLGPSVDINEHSPVVVMSREF